jgi:hypothetical protein
MFIGVYCTFRNLTDLLTELREDFGVEIVNEATLNLMITVALWLDFVCALIWPVTLLIVIVAIILVLLDV